METCASRLLLPLVLYAVQCNWHKAIGVDMLYQGLVSTQLKRQRAA